MLLHSRLCRLDETCSLIVRFERGKHRFRERVDPQEINTVHKEICLKPPKSPRSTPIKASRVSMRHNPNNEQDSWNVRNVHRFEFDMIDCRLCRLIRRDVFGSGRHPSSSAVSKKRRPILKNEGWSYPRSSLWDGVRRPKNPCTDPRFLAFMFGDTPKHGALRTGGLEYQIDMDICHAARDANVSSLPIVFLNR